jgi:uncharacterized membrane protein YuzA (DUF378 family)
MDRALPLTHVVYVEARESQRVIAIASAINWTRWGFVAVNVLRTLMLMGFVTMQTNVLALWTLAVCATVQVPFTLAVVPRCPRGIVIVMAINSTLVVCVGAMDRLA